MELTISPCLTLCDWRATGTTRADLPLLACAGCGSQWVRTEPWTPRNADGAVPLDVRAERAAGVAGNGGS